MPMVRARHLKTKLELLAPRAGGREALARIDGRVLAEVGRSHGMDWLPMGHEIAITRAAHEALGQPAVEELWIDTLLAEMDGLLFGPMTRAALTTPGWSQDRWPELLCKGWTLAFRNCGRWNLRPTGPRALDLRLERLPDACLGEPTWLASVASALSAVHRFLRNQGTFRLCGVEPPETALYRSTWSASAWLASAG